MLGLNLIHVRTISVKLAVMYANYTDVNAAFQLSGVFVRMCFLKIVTFPFKKIRTFLTKRRLSLLVKYHNFKHMQPFPVVTVVKYPNKNEWNLFLHSVAIEKIVTKQKRYFISRKHIHIYIFSCFPRAWYVFPCAKSEWVNYGNCYCPAMHVHVS